MGTLAATSSALYQPLDTILGSPSAVRILRVMANHGGLLTANLISLKARLNRSGVGRTLDHLVDTGVVERVGQGRSLLYRFAEDHPLAAALAGLFQSERRRVEGFMADVRSTAAHMVPEPIAVWQFGSTARGEDRHDSDFDLAVVWPDGPIRRYTDALADRLDEVGRKWSIKPSIVDFEVADVVTARQRDSAFWRNLCQDYVLIHGKRPDEVRCG